jgi:hypothetical protein
MRLNRASRIPMTRDDGPAKFHAVVKSGRPKNLAGS